MTKNIDSPVHVLEHLLHTKILVVKGNVLRKNRIFSDLGKKVP